jgi:hypothetical protein
MPKQIVEQAKLTESVNKKTGKILVDILTPGVGSSGYYSPEVVAEAADLVQPGTKMFIDHPTDVEAMERPIRSVKDIAAVFTEGARWDPARGEAGALVAEAQVVPAWIETMDVIQGAIGTSIRGSATDIVEGTRPDGTTGRIIEGLHAIDSVDFVTSAGRGGSFALMESASPSRVHARAIGHGISEATVNDTREALQTVLRDTYGAEKTYVWVRDFDETNVWFEIEAPDDSGIFAQTYSMSDSGAALSGDRTEVQVKTTYVPVTRPGSNNTTKESEEDTIMGNISIEEAEHRRLLEEAGRVGELQKENAALTAQNTELKESAAAASRDKAAGSIVEAKVEAAESDVEFTKLERVGLMANLPVTEAGELDTEAFTKRVEEAIAEKAVANGDGVVTGNGGLKVAEDGDPWSQIDEHLNIKKGA